MFFKILLLWFEPAAFRSTAVRRYGKKIEQLKRKKNIIIHVKFLILLSFRPSAFYSPPRRSYPCKKRNWSKNEIRGEERRKRERRKRARGRASLERKTEGVSVGVEEQLHRGGCALIRMHGALRWRNSFHGTRVPDHISPQGSVSTAPNPAR